MTYKNLYLLFYHLTKNRENAVSLLTWSFLPGTVIHELSHLLIAELLRVRTGELSFTPEIRENNQVRAGGLKMAKTDPLRHSLIGLAPTMVGITIISSISHFYLFPTIQQWSNETMKQSILLFVICYLLFVVNNTMFSSKKDLEAILFPLIIIAILGGALYLGNIKISLAPKTINFLTNLFKNLDLALGGTVVIDLIMLSLIKIMLRGKRKATSY